MVSEFTIFVPLIKDLFMETAALLPQLDDESIVLIWICLDARRLVLFYLVFCLYFFFLAKEALLTAQVTLLVIHHTCDTIAKIITSHFTHRFVSCISCHVLVEMSL